VPSDAAAPDARVAALEEDVAKLRSALADLQAQKQVPSSAPSARSEPRPRSHEEQMSALERQIAEPEDRGWARRAETELLDLYTPLLEHDPDLRLVDLRCRTTLCRVEWSVPADADLRALQDVPWEGSSIFVQTPRDDGTSSLVAYVGRKGTALP
jgi:hypothetical protein